MKAWLLDRLGCWLDRSGLAGRYARRDATRAIAVMYHGVADAPAPFYHWCQLPLDRFRAQLDYLRRHHRVLPVSRLVEQIQGDRPLPPAAAFITFDDGYRNNRTRALPELEARALPAMIFLSTGCISQGRVPWPEQLFAAFHDATVPSIDLSDWGLGHATLESERARWSAYADAVERLKELPRAEKNAALRILQDRLTGATPGNGEYPDLDLLDWEQAREMVRSDLIEFGAHGVHHEILSRLDDGEVEREVSQSCSDVAREVGAAPSVFAFPNGRRQDFDDRAVVALRSNGIRCAFSTEPGPIRPGDDPWALRRIGVGANMSHGLFVLSCCGVMERLRGLAGR